MADNKSDKDQINRRLQAPLDKIDKQVSDLYRSTYYSTDTLDMIQNRVSDDLNDAIKNIIDGDNEYTNISNASKLFLKIQDGKSTGSSLLSDDKYAGVNDLFTGSEITASIMDSFSKTKWIKEMDAEYDSICKYMPKLQVALDIKRDCVLCADTFSKEFISVTPKSGGQTLDKNVIDNNIKEMLTKYKIGKNIEKWYEDTSKYGEVFIYCVPYKTALKALLKNKGNTGFRLSEATSEDLDKAKIDDVITINESFNTGIKGNANVSMDDNGGLSIRIHPDKSFLIEDAIRSNLYLRETAGLNKFKSLSESFVIESGESFDTHLHKSGKDTEIKLDRTIGDELEWDDSTASDGLTSSNAQKSQKNLKINGAIIKNLPHDRVIPVYIEDTFFGIYYLKFEEESFNDGLPSKMFGSNTMGLGRNPVATDKSFVDKGDDFLKRVAAKISQQIDANFINANIDLKKEIYLLLSYNDKYNNLNRSIDMNVVFIPADDVFHLTFKQDEITHRGISDLYDSLVPAKQWIVLNLVGTLGQATRGYDRRAYFVKQSVDNNVATSLLNVVTAIKKGNFGVRQMESINNIVNILGRFNDFVIPVGPNGESPIQFETIPGQNFEPQTELMNTNEEAAINPICPIEIVNSSRQMDFAIRYTMTNAKLLRDVLKTQFYIETFGSELVTKIYNYEYEANVELNLSLPAPAFLSMTQGSQILQTANGYADAIAEIEMGGRSDEEKLAFKKFVIRKYMPSYLSEDDILKIKNEVKFKISQDKNRNEDDYV